MSSFARDALVFFLVLSHFNDQFILQQGNVILVDTPGIGGSGKVTQKLMEYLPNALSFIFVINVASAGGMQSDRVIYCFYVSIVKTLFFVLNN